MNWTITTDLKSGEKSVRLYNKSDALDRVCGYFDALRAGVISRLEVTRGDSSVFRISKNLPNIPCDNTYRIASNGKRYLMQEHDTCYSLSGENERGIISRYIKTFKWFDELANYLITERRVSAVKGERE